VSINSDMKSLCRICVLFQRVAVLSLYCEYYKKCGPDVREVRQYNYAADVQYCSMIHIKFQHSARIAFVFLFVFVLYLLYK